MYPASCKPAAFAASRDEMRTALFLNRGSGNKKSRFFVLGCSEDLRFQGFLFRSCCDSRLIFAKLVTTVNDLRGDHWTEVASLMPGGCKGKRGPRTNNRRFINALLWVARTGARWRGLLDRYGNFETVKPRYFDWIARGVLDDIF